MMIWLVIESDYDDSYVVAAYELEALACQHADEMGFYCQSIDISRELPSEVTDPAEIKKRKDEREQSASVERDRSAQQEESWRRRQATTIRDFGNPNLCHCQTFSSKPMWNEHGYCMYCGGFAPEVFRQTRGDQMLAEHIAKLDEHNRHRMMKMCFPSAAPERGKDGKS